MWWNALIIGFVVSAAYADVRTRRIPRELSMAGLVLGLVVHAVTGGFVDALTAAALAFTIGLAMFAIGAIGGGDVKLIAALGAMLGMFHWRQAMEVAIGVAAAMAVIEVVRHRAVVQTVRNIGTILKTLFQTGFKAHPVLNVQNTAALRSPFGVAAAVGTIVAIIR